jgi:hypothetical protein
MGRRMLKYTSGKLSGKKVLSHFSKAEVAGNT